MRRTPIIEKFTEKLFFSKYLYKVEIRSRPKRHTKALLKAHTATVGITQYKTRTTSTIISVFTSNVELFDALVGEPGLFIYEIHKPASANHIDALKSRTERVLLRKPFYGIYTYRVVIDNHEGRLGNVVDLHDRAVRCQFSYDNKKAILYLVDPNMAAMVRMSYPSALLERTEDPQTL